MADAVTGGGGIGKAAMEAVREMQQQMNQVNQAADPSKFEGAMESTKSQSSRLSTQQVGEVSKASDVLRSAKAGAVQTTDHAARVQPRSETKLVGMQKMIGDLVNGQNKLESIMQMATSGKQFNPQQLIALQAGVYRFSQELELTSKVIEKATGGIKQTMNTQV